MSDQRPKLPSRLGRWFERKRARAMKLLSRPGALALTASDAEAKADRQLAGAGRRQSWTVSKLNHAWSDVQVLARLIRAFVRGDYRDVSKATMGLIVGALVYFVSPIDAILDHLPLAGYLDDAAILAWVMSEVRAEVEAFRQWEARVRGRALPPAGAASDQSSSAA